MMTKVFTLLGICALSLLVQCETMETGTGRGGTMRVAGIVYYPDETNYTIIIPAGAQVIGAGGTNCTYIVEEGGVLTAHSGTNNTYRIKKGGSFQGFAHEATSCTVRYEEGAIIAKELSGEGTTFIAEG